MSNKFGIDNLVITTLNRIFVVARKPIYAIRGIDRTFLVASGVLLSSHLVMYMCNSVCSELFYFVRSINFDSRSATSKISFLPVIGCSVGGDGTLTSPFLTVLVSLLGTCLYLVWILIIGATIFQMIDSFRTAGYRPTSFGVYIYRIILRTLVRVFDPLNLCALAVLILVCVKGTLANLMSVGWLFGVGTLLSMLWERSTKDGWVILGISLLVGLVYWQAIWAVIMLPGTGIFSTAHCGGEVTVETIGSIVSLHNLTFNQMIVLANGLGRMTRGAMSNFGWNNGTMSITLNSAEEAEIIAQRLRGVLKASETDPLSVYPSEERTKIVDGVEVQKGYDTLVRGGEQLMRTREEFLPSSLFMPSEVIVRRFSDYKWLFPFGLGHEHGLSRLVGLMNYTFLSYIQDNARMNYLEYLMDHPEVFHSIVFASSLFGIGMGRFVFRSRVVRVTASITKSVKRPLKSMVQQLFKYQLVQTLVKQPVLIGIHHKFLIVRKHPITILGGKIVKRLPVVVCGVAGALCVGYGFPSGMMYTPTTNPVFSITPLHDYVYKPFDLASW